MSLALIWDNENQTADLGFNGKTLQIDHSFETIVLILLFTDRRSLDTDRRPNGDSWRRGWWFDSFVDSEDDVIGSRLWTLKGAKITKELLQDAEVMVREALNILIKKGAYAKLDVAVSQILPNRIGIEISAYKPSGSTPAWQKTWEYTL